MICMAKKSDKKSLPDGYKSAGAAVPEAILVQFNERAKEFGWTKERAYAVAMLLLTETGDEALIAYSKRVVNEYVKPLETAEAGRAESLAADLDAKLKGLRSGGGRPAAESAEVQPARRKANG